MRKRAGRVVKHQRTRSVKIDRDYSGERSPYWEWVAAHQPHDADGAPMEPPEANPDAVSSEAPTPFAQESGRISIGDISRKLTGQQKKVFRLYVQEGRDEADISALLKISRSAVRTYLSRIRERFGWYS